MPEMKQMKILTWIYWSIESQLTNVGMEMIRLDNAIGDIGIGVDVLVYSQMEVDKRGHIPSSALYWALKEGKVLYDATYSRRIT
jgi:hypothetical protein